MNLISETGTRGKSNGYIRNHEQVKHDIDARCCKLYIHTTRYSTLSNNVYCNILRVRVIYYFFFFFDIARFRSKIFSAVM